MADPGANFEHELEILRTEAEAAAQFFYLYQTILAVAADSRQVHQVLNSSALFWNTILAGLQTSTFIVLGRIFDQSSAHNVDRVLKIAQDHPEIFSKNALGKRKQRGLEIPPYWLPEYLEAAHVPTPTDFRRLRSHVQKQRTIYNNNYRDLRRKVFAHKELSDPAAVSALFARTNVRELERLLVFCSRLYDALWQLFFNGRKPILLPRRYSLKRIRDRPSPPEINKTVQERIAHEAEQVLIRASAAKQAAYAPAAKKTKTSAGRRAR